MTTLPPVPRARSLASTTRRGRSSGRLARSDGPMTGEIDASLLADDDGKVYFVYQDGKIARMKDGVRLINCARGGIIDEEALAEALRSGKVGGAAM